ncbi:MAG: bifunctional DNA-formamidopyrimidine glycosylase/DNA-(apurinic or apyrimidinic site) lyase [Gammaproteobacteria bacterium]|nr:bifunctional DNA-formamidopyrimidine glycosylase/DNA-(apurinic or apyrimidinic site) lyase [Gammaproteobacteria bacterium]MCP5136726.1 bifunctional DNA-formamidopyrimidine glycosylase/DNA-(apurinic or apyrimidinic site) lyase [Gammaproteobacteria bacterium]
MPELPEVETTRRGIEPHLLSRRVERVVVRDARLRWPVPEDLPERVAGACIDAVERRGKYLLLRSERGAMIVHLGMSGSLRVLPAETPPAKHDHIDWVLDDGRCLRLRDPRRFGCVLWGGDDPFAHPLLASLGPEPHSASFDGDYLFELSRGRKVNVKAFIMNSHVVVGVGNIYANESLFRAGIHPGRAAGRISRERYRTLATAICGILADAIAQGGTTLRDFTHSDGKPGYFSQQLQVYGRAGQPCLTCSAALRQLPGEARATVYCAHCQH